MKRVVVSAVSLCFAGMAWAVAAHWRQGDEDQKEYGIDLLNTSAAVESWVICGFTEGLKWPEETKTGTYRIGVLGDAELHKFLMNGCNMHPSGSQIVEIIACPEVPDDTYYHILYVGDVASPAWNAWRPALQDAPTVVVTHAEGGVPGGAMVNFHYVDGELKLQLDVERAERLQISIGNELKSWVE